MLIESLVGFSDDQYSRLASNCGLKHCSHSSGICSDSCYNCLYQIHYPERFIEQPAKKLYDCPKMLYHYVCQYSYLYANEMFCAFDEAGLALGNLSYYHIISIGCGGAADLMAFEAFYRKNSLKQKVSYLGIDINPLWAPIHTHIEEYCAQNDIKCRFWNKDAFA